MRLSFILSACLAARLVQAQVTQIDEPFDTDPCISADWLCAGSTKWIDPLLAACFPDPANPVQPADFTVCNLYDPPEGYILLTPAAIRVRGSIVRTEPLRYDSFRLIAEVEMRNVYSDPVTNCTVPADGMSIFIKGGSSPPVIVSGGGELGVCFGDGQPTMYFGFDNYNNGGANVNGGNDYNDNNHVEFGYSATGWPVLDPPPMDMGKGAWKHLAIPLNNGLVNTPNRFQVQVQVKSGLVTCDIGNIDVGMEMTRMFTYQIPDFEPFMGYLGMSGATGDCDQNHIIHSIQIIDLTGVCIHPPATFTRKITNDSRTDSLPVYELDDTISVAIAMSDIRGTDIEGCDKPAEVTIEDTVPAGWTATDISDGGTFDGAVVRWILTGADVRERTVTYKAVAASSDQQVTFSGTALESAENAEEVDIGGDASLSLVRKTMNGAIVQWLILGPFAQPGFDSPGVIQMSRDYLTDGAGIDESSVLPKNGDTVNTDFGVAASTGYYPTGANPTWRSHMVYDPASDLVDFNVIYADAFGGDPDQVMAYAVTYVYNPSPTFLDVTMQTDSDDSIEVLVGDCPTFIKSVPRGSLGVGLYHDETPVTLAPGVTRVMVKVFEGAGGFNFRLGFLDAARTPLEPPAIDVSLDPTANGGVEPTDEGCPIPMITPRAAVGKAPFNAHLSGARSFARRGRTIASYQWDFGDGSAPGSGADVDHTFTAPGAYTVKLMVTDSNGSPSLADATRDIHVFAGGIIIQGDDLDSLVLTGAARIQATEDGLKTCYSPPGDEATNTSGDTVTSSAELDIDITALPAGVVTFPVAVLIRNVGMAGDDHNSSFTLTQKTPTISSWLGFDLDTWDGETDFLTYVHAADNLKNVETFVDGSKVRRTQDPALADAYAPFAFATTGGAGTPGPAKFKLVAGINYIKLDNYIPGGITTGRPAAAGPFQDNGNQIAAIVLGGDSPDLEGQIVACPSMPLGLTATANETCQISLDWNDSVGTVTGYKVYRSAKSGGPYEQIGTTATSEYVDIVPTPKTAYYYKVAAYSGECESLLSSPKNGRTADAPCVEGDQFKRGDADGSGKLDLTDAISTLQFLYMGYTAPSCKDAADTDDSGNLDLTDAISSLQFQFMGGTPPAAPGPTTCGADPTPGDEYTDCTYPGC
jgi:hypothetical protein